MKVEFKENTKRFIEENNCHYTLSTESMNGLKTRYGIVIKSYSGSVLFADESWELETVLDRIESKIIEKEKEALQKRTPYETLKYNVDNIRKMYFKNNDNAKRLSRNETYNGWDVCLETRKDLKLDVCIRVHNAANVIIAFDAFTERYFVEYAIGYSDTCSEAWCKVENEIAKYISSDVELRKAELLNISK